MSCPLFRDGIRDKLQGIRRARIFRDRVVIQINEASHRVKGNVLENRPKSFGCRINLRLSRFRESDHFSIASALKIENTVVTPAMLIVANKASSRVGGKSRF